MLSFNLTVVTEIIDQTIRAVAEYIPIPVPDPNYDAELQYKLGMATRQCIYQRKNCELVPEVFETSPAMAAFQAALLIGGGLLVLAVKCHERRLAQAAIAQLAQGQGGPTQQTNALEDNRTKRRP